MNHQVIISDFIILFQLYFSWVWNLLNPIKWFWEEKVRSERKKKNSMDVILKWLRKVVNYHRHIRQSATKIQKIFRGYQSRCLVEEEIVKTLALYSKEVDALELLLRRGIQANVYESVSSQWIDCVLLLSGSCDAVNLSLQYRDLQTDKEQRITYLLRDIAEISRYTPVQYLSADDDRRGKWSAIPTTPINKSKSALPVRRISKGRYGFFTIVGSSLSKPSTQIAVDSKSTCIALVDSLRAVYFFVYYLSYVCIARGSRINFSRSAVSRSKELASSLHSSALLFSLRGI